jgi:acetyl esterase/lipase
MTMLTDRRALLAGLSLTPVAACATAPVPAGNELEAALRDTPPDAIIPLWPNGVPGGENVSVIEEEIARPNAEGLPDRIVRYVRTPHLSVFRPARANGSALLIIPGGGYRHVVIDKEGYEAARWFAARGVTSYVLRYRLPGDRWAAGPDVSLQDTQRAMRVIRAQAGIDPARVASIGFSAGGHVAASLATRFDLPLAPDGDTSNAKPDISCFMYPVITMGAGAHAGSRSYLLGENPSAEALARYSLENHARADMSPTMVIHAADDEAVPLSNGLAMYEALRRADVRSELHVFEEGGHGFGLRFVRDKPAGIWPQLFFNWGQRHGIFVSA